MIMDHMTGHMVTTTAGGGAVTAFVDSSCGEMHQSLTQPFTQYPVVLMPQYSSFTPVTPDHTVIQLHPVAEQGVKFTGDSQTCSLASDIGGPGAVESTEAACVEGKDSADDKLYMLSSVVSGPPTYIPISCSTTSVATVNYDPTLHDNESPHPTGLTEVNDVEGGSSQCCWDDPGTASQSQAAGVSASTELYVCEWTGCGKTFSVMEDLVNHVNDMHVKAEQDVIYKCCWKSCPRKGKGFNARYKMLIHVRTHTNEKPHKCKECSKTFSRLENLKIHHRSHTGEKPYICPFEGCTKAYSNSSDRFKHVQTHKTVKPYICRHHNCKKSYTDPSSLRKHIKIHGHYDDTSTSQQPDHNGLPSPGQSESVSASGLLSNINLSHIITLPGQTMSLANLAANPFLSSAVYSSSQCDNNSGSDRAGDTISSMPCSPVKELFRANSLHQDLTILVEVASNAQDSPLDLTTTPSPTHTDTIEL